MDRNRDARRSANLLASSTGIARRRHRTNSHRDSPDEDGAVELQESLRLRERVKKDRDRDRDRERDNRERDRERSTIRSSKRRRAERMMIHGSTRGGGGGGDDGGGGGGGGGEDTSEESVNDEEEDEGDNNHHSNNNNHHHHNHHKSGSIIGGGGVRLMPPMPNNNNNSAASAAVAGISPVSNHYHNGNSNNNHNSHNSNYSNTSHHHHHQQQQQQQQQQHNNLSQARKNFPPTGAPKVVPTAPVLKFGDEMIGVSVPRKARSASTKRSHDWMSSSTTTGGVGVVVGEHLNRQTSISPARPSLLTAPLSPSSSNISAKKLKPSSSKQLKPPKSSSLKSNSGNPEELEIEIAEVLFGLKTQPQAPPKKVCNDSAEINRSSSDAKSRVSSPMSNSPTANIQSSPAAVFPPNSCSSACSLTAVVPKRKKPRPVSDIPGGLSVRSSPISSMRPENDRTSTKVEALSSISEKNPGSGVENGHSMVNTDGLSPVPESLKKRKVPEESKPVAEGLGESPDVISKKEVVSSPKKESPVQEAAAVDENSREDVGLTVTALSSLSKGNSDLPTQREEKFLIDLEASPPQRDDLKVEIELKPVASVVDAETKSKIAKEDEKLLKLGKVDADVVGGGGGVDKKVKGTVEESEGFLKKVEINKGKNVVDLEKPERDNNNNNGFVSKLAEQSHKHQQHLLPSSKSSSKEDFQIGQSNGLPLTMASWPGGLPPMGYMTPMPVVTMDGSTISPAPVQPVFSLPKPKRCATHCYIAKKIEYIQQLMKMNPFWQAASGFGSKPCNISAMPQMDLPGNMAPRAVINAPDRAPPGLAMIPGQVGKDKCSQPANVADSGQRKQQILLQQTMPHVPPNSMLGPTFIFPINQQQAAVAASARPGMAVKHPSTATSGGLASSGAPNAAATSASPTAGSGGAGQGPAVSFSYPNMPAGYETQYLAILQNNYPFPIPAVGAAPQNYRGTHPQPLPFLNGSFYPSQIIHPSQLQQSQQQQQQQQQSVSQSHQMQHHQHSLPSNPSSQKHMQQQRQGGAASGNGGVNLQNFPAAKSSRQLQQSQQHQSHQSSARQVENEGQEDSSSTGDSRGGNRVPQNIYAQNFVMPMHHQNYAMMASPAAALASVSATSSGSNHNHNNEKRQQQQQQQQQQQHVQPQPQQQQSVKTTTEPLPQAFAMSFAPVNGATNNTAPGYDLSSLAQNNAILQSLPEATRQNIQMMAMNAAQVLQSQQRKNLRISDEGRTRDGADSANTDDDRKAIAGMSPVTAGQSIAFSRAELSDASVSASLANNLNDSSTRSSNLAPGSSWTARSTMPNSQSQQAQHHHHHQQMMQIHKQQQQQQQQQLAAASSARSKTQGNINVFPEHMSSTMTSSAAKFPNGLSGFPQSLVQTGSSNNSSQIQSPQWRNPARPSTTAQSPSPFVSSTSSLNKAHHHHQQQQQQQQGRTPQGHTQISFGSNQKPAANLQGQPLPSSSQSPSSPMMVGSPSSSSMSRGAGGSPRNASGSAAHNSKNTSVSTAQVSSLSSQHAKSSSLLGQKNAPSILGNPHVSSSSSSANKSQLQQQAQQAQQLQKNLHQAQLFFSNPYVQSQIQNFSSTNSNAAGGGGGFPSSNSNAAGGGGSFPNTNSNAGGAGNYINRNQPQTQQQLGAVSSASSSSGILSLCPVSLAASGTTDPAKAIAAATSTMKGSNSLPPSHGILNAASQHQISPASFAYVHSVPAAVQVKSSSDQKQPAGNDNLHASWQPEKK